MPFTDFFLDYVPMYDKFRTVASILVIAEFTIPLLGMLALKQVVEKGVEMKPLLISFGLTGGFALLFWLMPDVFFGNYVSTSDMAYMNQYVQAGYIPQDMMGGIVSNMSEMRRAMFTSDALRSFFVIALGFIVMLVWRWGRIKTVPMVACLTLLCLADMWDVNKRYLNDGMFSKPRTNEQSFPKTSADEIILQDETPYYRVLDMSVSTFNDNTTSYYHKSIGGYHAAKLRRYQELIEEHIHREMGAIQKAAISTEGNLDQVNGDSLFPVLNMLNTRYVILASKDGQKMPVKNTQAYGNAWFVSQLDYVEDADAELAALHEINPRKTAVVDKKYLSTLGELTELPDSSNYVELTGYEANQLSYTVNSKQGGIVVFSDIYYPSWTCTIDGEDVPIARADYVLRAVRVPAGNHTVVMRFDPRTVHTTEAIAYGGLAVLALLLIGLAVREILKSRGRKKEEELPAEQS
jgi:hypothetical protein